MGEKTLKRYTKEEAIRILNSAAKEYQSKMSGRFFVIIYYDKVREKILYKKIKFTKGNFKHLTGVKYMDNVQSGDFLKLCLNGKLSPEKIIFRNDGFTELKLSVLPYLSSLFYNPFWIGDSINNDITINADYFTGDKTCRVSLGFRSSKDDFPVSLKCQSIRETVKKENDVLIVYTRKIGNDGQWEAVYKSKDFSEEMLKKETIYKELETILLK